MITHIEARIAGIVSSPTRSDAAVAHTEYAARFVSFCRSHAALGRAYIQYASRDATNIDVRVGAMASRATDMVDELHELLSVADSPYFVRQEDIRVHDFGGLDAIGPWDHMVYRVARATYLEPKTGREFGIPIVRARPAVADLFAMLLRHPRSGVRISFQSVKDPAGAVRRVLEDQLLRPPRTDEVLETLATSGDPMSVRMTFFRPFRDGSVNFESVLNLIAGGLVLLPAERSKASAVLKSEIAAQVLDSGPDVTAVGTETSVFALFPEVWTSFFPGVSVYPSQLRRVSHNVPRGSSTHIRLGSGLDASGRTRPVGIARKDADRHIYIPGQTGSGKSTMLRAIAREVAAHGEGLLFVDPHGQTVEKLLGELPPERADDVIFVDAADLRAVAPINPFAGTDSLQRDTALENVTAMFYDLFDPNQTGIVGPRWETWFRMGMTTLLAAFEDRASLLDVPSIFVDKDLLNACKAKLDNPVVSEFWEKEMAQTSDYHKSEILGWFSSKFSAFRMNSVLRATLGTGSDVIDPTSAMDDGKIMLVSLSKGEIGAPITQLLGYVYLTRFWSAALRRRSPRPFTIFVDEVQSFAKGSLPAMLAEGRKFGVRVVMANQYLEQLPVGLRESVLGNVGSIIGLRLGAPDANALESRFSPEFDARSMMLQPNFYACTSLLAGGAIEPAFSLYVDYESTMEASKLQQSAQSRRIRAASRRFLSARYAEATFVSESTRARLSEDARASRLAKQGGVSRPSTGLEGGSTGSSFLDEWLAKRKTMARDAGADDSGDVPNGDG